MRPYLCNIKKNKNRIAIAKNRHCSQILEFGRGRHTKSQTSVADKNCLHHVVVEDEKDFLLNCYVNAAEIEYFFDKTSEIYDRFLSLNDDKFSHILTNYNPQCVTWFGEFIHDSFEKKM